MPTLDGTTTAVFASVGVTATTVYSFLTTLFLQALYVGIWLIEAMWPFLLVAGVLGLFYAVAGKMLHWGR